MAELPRGTVTFAFTDIEGSTALLKELGEGYGELISQHRRLVRTVFADYDGIEIDTQGDAFFFVFVRARDAVAAAAGVQKAHFSATWPSGSTVRMRVGLHTGEPSLGEEGYLGIDVVRAARLCGSCEGGQVLMSETTRALLGSNLPDGVTVFPLGERHLKDIDQPEQVYELEIEGAVRPVPSEEVSKSAGPVEKEETQESWEDQLEQRLTSLTRSAITGALDKIEQRFTKKPTDEDPEADSEDLERFAGDGEGLAKTIQDAIDRALRSEE